MTEDAQTKITDTAVDHAPTEALVLELLELEAEIKSKQNRAKELREALVDRIPREDPFRWVDPEARMTVTIRHKQTKRWKYSDTQVLRHLHDADVDTFDQVKLNKRSFEDWVAGGHPGSEDFRHLVRRETSDSISVEGLNDLLKFREVTARDALEVE